MFIQDKQLKDFIADSSLVSKADLDIIANEAIEKKQSLSDMLISKGKMTEDDLRRVKAYILGVPFVDLKDQKIDFNTLSLIPEPIARKNNIVAYNKINGMLEVAMLNIDDLVSVDFIKKKTDRD
jgi:type IV pilus assembly protein PilB